MSKVIGEIIIGKIQENMEDKAVEERIEVIIIEVKAMIEVGIGLEKGHFPETMTIIEIEVQAIVDQGWDLEVVQKGIEKGVISVGNLIILQKTAPPLGKKGNRTTPTDTQSGRKPNLSTDKYTKQSNRKSKTKSFKLMNGRNDTTTVLPLKTKIGGQIDNNRPSIGQFLTREQTRYIYKKT